MEVLHHVRPKRRVGIAGAIGLASLLALLAPACRDEPRRASEPVDTATLQDRRIYEGDTGRDTSTAVEDTLAIADTAAGTMVGDRDPTLVLAADSAAGFLLYHRSAGCIACHGADAAGLENLGPSLRDSVWLHIDGSLEGIEQVIRAGIAQPREALIAMPALASRLDAAETYRVAGYIYALSHPHRVVADTAAARDSLRAFAADTLGAARTPPPDATSHPPSSANAQARRHQR